MANIRYITATHIGTWAMDKLIRFCLLPQGDEPIMWDFGSAARHHELYNPWLGEERSRAGISTLRGVAVEGRAEVWRRRSASSSRSAVFWESRGCRRRRASCAPSARSSRNHCRRRTGPSCRTPARSRPATRSSLLEHGLRHGRCCVRGALPCNAARNARERLRRPCEPGPLRARLGARRGRERNLGRALQPASARLHRPDAALRRPRLLRHPPRL